jgi:hypothetical protein
MLHVLQSLSGPSALGTGHSRSQQDASTNYPSCRHFSLPFVGIVATAMSEANRRTKDIVELLR